MIGSMPLAPYARRMFLNGGGGIGNSVGGGLFNAGSGFANPGAPSKNVGNKGSTLDQLMAKIMASLGSGGYAAPSQYSLEQQARSAVDMQFSPQEAALRRAMAGAKTNAAYSKTAVGKLFQGLAQSYQTDKKETKQLFKESKENEKARLEDYTNATKENYQESMDYLAKTYKDLGIEAAAGESTTGALTKDKAENIQEGIDDSAANQKQLGQQETSEQVYWQEGIGTAKMEGTQRKADLDMLLNQYLTDAGGKLEDLKAQRQAAYTQALAQLQAQVADQAAKQSNETWDRMMQLANFQYKQQQSSAAAANKGFGKGLTGANKYLYEQFVNSQWGPSEAERYSSILQGIILRLPPGISPEQASQFAANEANRQGISPSVMARAMLAYQGRL